MRSMCPPSQPRQGSPRSSCAVTGTLRCAVRGPRHAPVTPTRLNAWMGAELTLGAEEELHVVDLETWQLSTSAARLLSRLDDSYSSEMQRSTVETRTAVTTSLAGLRSEITRLRARL